MNIFEFRGFLLMNNTLIHFANILNNLSLNDHNDLMNTTLTDVVNILSGVPRSAILADSCWQPPPRTRTALLSSRPSPLNTTSVCASSEDWQPSMRGVTSKDQGLTGGDRAHSTVAAAISQLKEVFKPKCTAKHQCTQDSTAVKQLWAILIQGPCSTFTFGDGKGTESEREREKMKNKKENHKWTLIA